MYSTENMVFSELKWDTDYFGVTCAKAILKNELTIEEWNSLKEKFKSYQFVSIQNLNSNGANAKLIGEQTKAFLADVNIQFVKAVEPIEIAEDLEISNNYKRDDRILKLANFEQSKFIKDDNLKSRGGEGVYTQWILNSFEKDDKYFIVCKESDGTPNGFLLYFIEDDRCIISLIAAKGAKGIGTKMVKSLENEAYKSGIKYIQVGTQCDNIGAMNFYNKLGFRQSECHQIFHLWNL